MVLCTIPWTQRPSTSCAFKYDLVLVERHFVLGNLMLLGAPSWALRHSTNCAFRYDSLWLASILFWETKCSNIFLSLLGFYFLWQRGSWVLGSSGSINLLIDRACSVLTALPSSPVWLEFYLKYSKITTLVQKIKLKSYRTVILFHINTVHPYLISIHISLLNTTITYEWSVALNGGKKLI